MMTRDLWVQQVVKNATAASPAVVTFAAADFPTGTKLVFLAWFATSHPTSGTPVKVTVAQGAVSHVVGAPEYEFNVQRFDPPMKFDITAGDVTVTFDDAAVAGNPLGCACMVWL